MGCEPLAVLGGIVVFLAASGLLIFLGHVCYWAYKNRDVHERVLSLPGWKDIINSWEWTLTKDRLRELENRLLILETAPKPEPPKKR